MLVRLFGTPPPPPPPPPKKIEFPIHLFIPALFLLLLLLTSIARIRRVYTCTVCCHRYVFDVEIPKMKKTTKTKGVRGSLASNWRHLPSGTQDGSFPIFMNPTPPFPIDAAHPHPHPLPLPPYDSLLRLRLLRPLPQSIIPNEDTLLCTKYSACVG